MPIGFRRDANLPATPYRSVSAIFAQRIVLGRLIE